MSDRKVSEPVVIADSTARLAFDEIHEGKLHTPPRHTFGSVVSYLANHRNFRLQQTEEKRRAYFKIKNGRYIAPSHELVVNTTTGGEEFGGVDPSGSGASFKVAYFSKHIIKPHDQYVIEEQFAGYEDNLEAILSKAATYGLSLEALDELLQKAGLPRTNMEKTRATYDLDLMGLISYGDRRDQFPTSLKVEVKNAEMVVDGKRRKAVEVNATYNPDFKTAKKFKPKRSETTKEIGINLLDAAMRKHPGT